MSHKSEQMALTYRPLIDLKREITFQNLAPFHKYMKSYKNVNFPCPNIKEKMSNNPEYSCKNNFDPKQSESIWKKNLS